MYNTVIAAESFKIKCDLKFPKADFMILNIVEGKQLRGRISDDDVTPLKLVNLYKKKIKFTLTPDKYLKNDISSLQEPGMHTYIRLHYRKSATEASDVTYNVLLVNAHNKPVYTADDVTDSMTLKLTEVKKAEASTTNTNMSSWLVSTARELAQAGVGFEIVVATVSENVWIVKGPKGRITNACPVAGLTEYIKQYGSRGTVTVTENKREGAMLVFSRGCKMFKGTAKSLLEKLKEEKEAHSAIASPTPAQDEHGMGTLVGFRKVKKDGEIIAVFPRDIGRNGKVTIFTFSDEHGEVDPKWITRNTVPATAIEYRDLQSALSKRYGKITYAPSSVVCQLLKAGKK